MLFPSTIKIRNLEVSPPLALAPMVGISHSAMRTLVQELGGVGLLFTEMLSAKRLPDENENVSPSLIRSADEFPLFYQVFLNNSSVVLPALEKLHKINPQGVDLNFGCPAPKLRKQGAGCFLTKDRSLVKKIISTFRKNTSLPLTAKVRLGDTHDIVAFTEFCKIVEGEGVDCLTIHARFNNEKFCRKPRWHWIEKAKNCIKIPIIANGGIFTVEDARKCLTVSGADGLMIGRGAAWRPWIFSDICEQVYGLSKKREKLHAQDVYNRFFELLIERFTRERRLGRLKQFTHYFARTHTFGHHLASAIQSSDTMEQALERSNVFFEGKKVQYI